MSQSANPKRNLTNEMVKARVLRITPAGLVVVLPDGQEGLVREREIAWHPTLRQDWTARYKPGDTVQVVELGKGRERRPEVSMRLAQAGSWIGIEQRYLIGSLVDGVVTGIMPYGVFVELESGITGLVHTSRLPTWAQKPPGELFWPGDLVKAVIQDIDARRQRIALSMADLLSRRWRDATQAHELGSTFAEKHDGAIPKRLSMDMLFAQPPQAVLVVEDDDAQRKAVADWLRDAGQTIAEAASAEEALERIPTFHPDLVLMDVGLPGMNGVEVARHITARWPETRCVLVTDWSRAERYTTELQPLHQAGVSLLIKPLLPEDLLGALLASPGMSLSTPDATPSVRTTLERPKRALARAEQSELSEVLLRLASVTRADKAVVFELDPDARQVKLLEQRGPAATLQESLPELIHSPVRDVAEIGQVVAARNAAEAAERRFLHLKPYVDFEACLGVPVPTHLRLRYALFLFFGQPIVPTEALLTRAETAAASVGAWLERRQFVRQTADLQRTALLGQLARALVHEISGRLTPINLALERLQSACDQVERYAGTSSDQVVEEMRRARQELLTLSQQAQILTRTTHSFSRMTRRSQEDIVRLEDVIGEAVDVLSDAAATARVSVVVRPAPRLFFTRAQVTFLQQSLVNIVQNAIQQIHLARPQQGGRVEISLTHISQGGQPRLRVRVEDDGPGIHRRLWERIFEMDYTLRPEGSGLGLYISRSLLEAQGSRVYVAESHILWGAAFEVELPYRT